MRSIIISLALLIPCLANATIFGNLTKNGGLPEAITFTPATIAGSTAEIRTADLTSVISTAASGNNPLIINAGASGVLGLNTLSSGPVVMSLTPSSNVGIKTASPALPLDVNGAAQFGAGPTKSTFTAAGGLLIASGSGIRTSTFTLLSTMTIASVNGDGSSAFISLVSTSVPNFPRVRDALLINESPAKGGALIFNVAGQNALYISTNVGGVQSANGFASQGLPGDGCFEPLSFSFDSDFSLCAQEGGGGLYITDNNFGTTPLTIANNAPNNSFAIDASGNISGVSSVTASAFFGDGSHLTGIGFNGGTVANQTTFLSTVTVLGNAFSVGGSAFAVVGGSVGIGTNTPTSKLTVFDGDIQVSTTGGSRGIIFQDGSKQITAATGGGAVHGQQLFTASGNFTVPTGVTMVWLTGSAGGGGAGGQGGGGMGRPGGGGGGGQAAISSIVIVTAGASIPVTIGVGGTGGAAGTTGDGSDGIVGGNTLFGGLLTLTGGGFGGGGTSAPGTPGASGGFGATPGSTGSGGEGVPGASIFGPVSAQSSAGYGSGGGSTVGAGNAGNSGFLVVNW